MTEQDKYNFARESGEGVAELQSDDLNNVQRIGKIGSWTLDISSGDMTWSEELYRLLGFNPQQSPPNFFDLGKLFKPASFEKMKLAVTHATETGLANEVELEFYNPAGARGWILTRAEVVRDEFGKIAILNGISVDITERKEAELLASEYREKLEVANQSLSAANAELLEAQRIGKIGSWTMDVATNRVVWTEELFRMLGLDPTGPPPDYTEHPKLFAPESWELLQYELDKTLATGEPYELELKVSPALNPDGWVLARGEALKDSRNDVVKLRGTAMDITGRKQSELLLDQYTREIEAALMGTVGVAMRLNEIRDPYTAGHQNRVARLSEAIAREMGLDEERVKGIVVAAQLHDIGKVIVPVEILVKPISLTSTEMEIVRDHARAGHDVLRQVAFRWPVAEVALQHHERMDGSGYPQGLKGSEILLEARIVAVADVVESMASHRPYRASLGVEAALEEIAQNSGRLYDPEVSRVCLALFSSKHYDLFADNGA